MALANLEVIRIGLRDQSIGSDSLYDAFHKIRNNFANLNNASVSTNIVAGNGINVTNISGIITITNTGVTNLVAGSGISLNSSNGNVTITASSSSSGTVTSVGVNSNTLTVTGSPITSSGNITIEIPSTFSSNTVTANTVNANNNISIGNTSINWATITTTSISPANLINIAIGNNVGFQFFLTSVDNDSNSRYVTDVIVITDGTNMNYNIYSKAELGTNTGEILPIVSGGNLRLQVTPESSNTIVWTTQYKKI